MESKHKTKGLSGSDASECSLLLSKLSPAANSLKFAAQFGCVSLCISQDGFCLIYRYRNEIPRLLLKHSTNC